MLDCPGLLDQGRALAWVLVSANNRVLGRSADLFATVPECHADIDYLRAQRADAVGLIIPAVQRHRWAWRLEYGPAALAISGRSYFRRAECSYNLARFLDAVPAAALLTGIRPRRR